MEDFQARHFRDDLRTARAAVLADAEAYALPYHALERLGRFLNPKAISLKGSEAHLQKLAEASPLSGLSEQWPAFHRRFSALLSTARVSRNDVMHVGARARHLTTFAVEACLILEDALQQRLNTVGDFMVPNPVCAEMWHPLSLVRQRMLEHAFTNLPISPSLEEQFWYIISDYQLAAYLGNEGARKDRMATSIDEGRKSGLAISEARIIDAKTPKSEALKIIDTRPLLVREDGRVVGIVTAFDLL